MAAAVAAAALVVVVPVVTHGGSAEAGTPVLAVYGDSYSAGGRQGGKGAEGWPAIVADRLDADLRLHAAGGAGYVNGSQAADETFLDQVRGAAEPDADVVVVFGSRNDKFLPVAEVKSQAVAVYEAIRAQSPTAHLASSVPPGTTTSRPRNCSAPGTP